MFLVHQGCHVAFKAVFLEFTGNDSVYVHGGTQMTCTPVASYEGKAGGEGPTRLHMDFIVYNNVSDANVKAEMEVVSGKSE